MNPVKKFVIDYVELIEKAKRANFCPPHFPKKSSDVHDCKKVVLIFSPHPDDESIIGALPLRLLHELGYEIKNVAVTLGSKVDRKPERSLELQHACDYLGFGLIVPNTLGLDGVNLETKALWRTDNTWDNNVKIIIEILQNEKPDLIFMPHESDGHKTHVGTYWLVTDALNHVTKKPVIIETEYWHQNWKPNLMVESSIDDVATLVAAVSCHKGEVTRNPYNVSLLAWMHDNVRRGSEMLGGVGGAISRAHFATIYKVVDVKEKFIVSDRESLKKFVQAIVL